MNPGNLQHVGCLWRSVFFIREMCLSDMERGDAGERKGKRRKTESSQRLLLYSRSTASDAPGILQIGLGTNGRFFRDHGGGEGGQFSLQTWVLNRCGYRLVRRVAIFGGESAHSASGGATGRGLSVLVAVGQGSERVARVVDLELMRAGGALVVANGGPCRLRGGVWGLKGWEGEVDHPLDVGFWSDLGPVGSQGAGTDRDSSALW